MFCISVPFLSWLRSLGLALAICGLVVLPACWVESISGLDEGKLFGSADHDRIFEPALVGAWTMQQDKCSVTIRITAERDVYTWRENGEGEDCADADGKKELYYQSTLYKLAGYLFLDLTARAEDICDMCRARHWIFKVQLDKDSVALIPIDSDWLKKSVESKTVSLSTLSNDTDVITATPKELKEFCRKYADDKAAFKPLPGFVLNRK